MVASSAMIRGAGVLFLASLWVGFGQPACAQVQLADDLVILAGESARQNDRAGAPPAPGGSHSRLGSAPGAGEAAIEPLPGLPTRVAMRRDVLSAAANPIPQVSSNNGVEVLDAPLRSGPAELPPGVSLEVPAIQDEGPSDGLTLDSAIASLLQGSRVLRAKSQEIPKATADVLTAGLRANPLVFASVDDVPYGQYSPARPGETGYGLTVIQPVDINQKRAYRVIAAERAKSVTHAQYQDAVRVQIDELYTRYIDVVAARETVRYVEASIAGLREARSSIDRLVRMHEVSPLELNRLDIQIEVAELAHEEATIALDSAKRALALLLGWPSPDVHPYEIRAAVTSALGVLPHPEEAVSLAQANRPDLRAYYLGLARANAEVDLATKERYPDVFVLYTPWGLTDNTPTGGQDASSWGVSGMASVPLFNRNQGNIRRAEVSSHQARVEWQQVQDRVDAEVRQAMKAVRTSSAKVRRLENSILPASQKVREQVLAQLQAGQIDALTYLQARRDYVDIVRQYRDALIQLRRDTLHVNTVVGMRLVP